MTELGFDGQNKRQPLVNVMNCFFCLQDKPNCGGYVLNAVPDAPPASAELLKEHLNKKFVICKECQKKAETDPTYIQNAIASFILGEDYIKRESGKLQPKRKK